MKNYKKSREYKDFVHRFDMVTRNLFLIINNPNIDLSQTFKNIPSFETISFPSDMTYVTHLDLPPFSS